MGEGEGGGKLPSCPLTSILSPGGERKYLERLFLE
jgi:hypothetical protein